MANRFIQATCWNARRQAPCLVDLDADGCIRRSSAVSFGSIDGTADYDDHFRRWCRERGIEIEIYHDGGHGYAAWMARRLAA